MAWSISLPWLPCMLNVITLLQVWIKDIYLLHNVLICLTHKFSGFHSILSKDSILLGYDALRLVKQFPTFQAHVGVSSSKVKMSKKNSPNLEDATTTLSWNVWNNWPSSMASYPLVDRICHSFAFFTYFGNSTFFLWQLIVLSYWLFKVQQGPF